MRVDLSFGGDIGSSRDLWCPCLIIFGITPLTNDRFRRDLPLDLSSIRTHPLAANEVLMSDVFSNIIHISYTGGTKGVALFESALTHAFMV